MTNSIYDDRHQKICIWLQTKRKESGKSLRALEEDIANLNWHLNLDHTVLNRIEKAQRKLELIEFLAITKCLGVDPKDGIDTLNI